MNSQKNQKKRSHVFIVSDATGVTAERVTSATMAQFRQTKPIFKRFPYVKTGEQIRDIMARAEKLDALVVFSLASRDLRMSLQEEERNRKVPAVDILGPLMERMSEQWNMAPAFRSGLFKGPGQESIRLAAAIDFTLRHDDGQGINTLGQADLIILGVSRTSKTPTSLYISCNNSLRVANVPIIRGVDPPKKIFTLKRPKVGFTIAPERLAFLRETRLGYGGPTDYANVELIREELEYSRAVFKEMVNLRVIDVTNRSIEEVAGMVVRG